MTELAKITEDGKLVTKEKWTNHIKSLYVDANIRDIKKGIAEIRVPFIDAIKKRLPSEKFSVLFSGGVDSTLIALICKNLGVDFDCITVGLEDSKDIEVSTKIAKELGISHIKKILTDKDVEKYFEKAAVVLGNELINIINLGVGAVVLAALEVSKPKIVFSGLGSEEIFAGYSRHGHATDINAECWAGLVSMYDRDLKRDCTIAMRENVTFCVPFMDTEIISAAMRLDSGLKIKNGVKKYVLRELAYSLGLPKEYAFRPKSAAQYGSKIDKVLERLKTKYGFPEKGDYVRSLRKGQ